jgi:hypothetical protein
MSVSIQGGSATRLAVGVACLWGLTATLARAVRWPNDFAEAHWLLDYQFGFVKRGFAGQALSTLLGLVGMTPTEAVIAAVSACVLAVFCAVLLWVSWQIARADSFSPASGLAVLAFLTSPFIVMSGHLNGYFDSLLVMLTVTAVVFVGRRRMWLAAVAMTIAVLIHESAIVIGYPTLLLAWWLSRETDSTGAGGRSGWPLGLPVLAFGIVAASATVLPADFQDAYSAHLAGFPFVAGDMHLLVPEWLTPGFLDQLATHRFAERIAFAEMYGLVLPTVVALLAYTVDAFSVRVRSVTMWGMLVAVLAPQVMHLAAWDTTRIWTYSIATALVVCWTVARTAGPARPVATSVGWLALAAIVVNAMAMTPLLDNLADRYQLTTRLVMYLPVIATAVWLVSRHDDPTTSVDSGVG